jgi:hypothetical protein
MTLRLPAGDALMNKIIKVIKESGLNDFVVLNALTCLTVQQAIIGGYSCEQVETATRSVWTTMQLNLISNTVQRKANAENSKVD